MIIFSGRQAQVRAVLAPPVSPMLVLAISLSSAGFAPYPPDASPFCPKYHPVHDGNVYDPSGPLQDKSGLWHTWEDDGQWSHWTSRDLVHWEGSFKESSHFSADTGSVSPTPSGVYAFWPIMSGPGRGAIGSAKATDDSLTNWTHRGPTIPMPTRINTGYRDPVRAFSHGGKWWVGVGCGSKEEGAQFCLFEAATDELLNFTDRGSLYTTNRTFGSVDADIVWRPVNVPPLTVQRPSPSTALAPFTPIVALMPCSPSPLAPRSRPT